MVGWGIDIAAAAVADSGTAGLDEDIWNNGKGDWKTIQFWFALDKMQVFLNYRNVRNEHPPVKFSKRGVHQGYKFSVQN